MKQEDLNLKVQDLANEIAHGPSLFDAGGKPTEAVERYTGAKLTRDTERCTTVAALKLLGYSDRHIARVIGCDTRSIPLMTIEAERRGLIPALKERLAVLVGRAAEQSTIAVQQMIDETLDGERSLEHAATLKAIGQVNTFLLEKNQLLTGAATERIEQVVRAGRDEIEAWAKSAALPIEVSASPVDAASSPNPPLYEEINSLPQSRHNADTKMAGTADQIQAAANAQGSVAAAGGGSVLRDESQNQTMDQ